MPSLGHSVECGSESVEKSVMHRDIDNYFRRLYDSLKYNKAVKIIIYVQLMLLLATGNTEPQIRNDMFIIASHKVHKRQ